MASSGRSARELEALISATRLRLRIAVVPQAITSDEITTRYSLHGTASYVLTEIARGRPVARVRVSSLTPYTTTWPLYPTVPSAALTRVCCSCGIITYIKIPELTSQCDLV